MIIAFVDALDKLPDSCMECMFWNLRNKYCEILVFTGHYHEDTANPHSNRRSDCPLHKALNVTLEPPMQWYEEVPIN